MISVIMLTFNRENMLPLMLGDILAQTLRELELIVVDNGSTDRSGVIAEDYAARDGRVRVLHRDRGSIGAGRNTGLDAARGNYIAFVDDDDRAQPDYLDFLLRLLQEQGADAAVCGTPDRAFDEKLLMTGAEAVLEMLRRRRFHTGFPAKLFQRELFAGLRFPEGSRFEDIQLMYRVLAKARRVSWHGLPKYRAIRHAGNHSAWTTDYALLTPEILDEYRRVYRARTIFLCERFPEHAAAFRYFERSFLLSMIEKIDRFQLLPCAAQSRALVCELIPHKRELLSSPELKSYERDWISRYL